MTLIKTSTLIGVALIGFAVSLTAQTPPPAPALSEVEGQQQAGAPPQAAPPAGQRGGGGGGGRGGRGSIQVMTLSTKAWLDGAMIPIRYTQAGAEVSPPLTWSEPPVQPPPPPPAPPGTLPTPTAPPPVTPPANPAPPPVPWSVKSFALIVHDIDAPSADLTTDTLHWMVWNIPASSRGLPEHVPQGAERGDGSRQISATGPYYRGPGAPATGAPHHYVFDLYALDGMIDVPAVGATVAQTRAAVMTAMAGHVRGKASLVGRFKYAAATVPVKK